MSLSEYWTDKTVSWNGVTVGFAIWIFALVLLLLAEMPVYVTAKAAKSDDIGVRRDATAISDFLTDKEYDLLDCLYCQ